MYFGLASIRWQTIMYLMSVHDTLSSIGSEAMPIELRQMSVPATRPHDPVGYVQFFAGDGADVERSEQWIRGQVPTGLPAMKSVALLQIVALQRARDLLND